MPDHAVARQELECGVYGTVLLFEVCDIHYRREDDPYHKVLVELDKEGLHRNVFLVDHNGQPVWRVADYEQPLPDMFIKVRRSENSADEVIGYTFSGFIFAINLADGSLRKLGWEKS